MTPLELRQGGVVVGGGGLLFYFIFFLFSPLGLLHYSRDTY